MVWRNAISIYPEVFDSPDAVADEPTRRLLEFFAERDWQTLEERDRAGIWYQDWLDYQAEHGLYASVLSPRQFSTRGHELDLRRLTQVVEVLAYCSPAHAYSLQVTFLGLFPILLGANEDLKREAISRLETGDVFAFGVSEQAHGADVYGNEFIVKRDDGDNWTANGSKYYIGNANVAGMITILARQADADSGALTRRSPFVCFALRPGESQGFERVEKIHTLGIRSAYVARFDVRNHIFPESDIISNGRAAWESLFATVNLGKFFLGFGAIGICEHAFAEAFSHMRRRQLYGVPVSSMLHLQRLTTFAFARLTAMKLFAQRALDYLATAGEHDRRSLLYTAVQKARVSTEGVKVIAMLSECIGARGYEAETYFETALRDVQMIPSLEGSTHINFGLTAQFINAYLSPDPQTPGVPHGQSSGENPSLLQRVDRNAKTVRFSDYREAFAPLIKLTNVAMFLKQIDAFRELAAADVVSGAPDDVALGIGKCLAIVAFAQLVAEKSAAENLPQPLVSAIFHTLIEDFSSEALKLAAQLPAAGAREKFVADAVGVPHTTLDELAAVAQFVDAQYA